jgi:hypothetical protein
MGSDGAGAYGTTVIMSNPYACPTCGWTCHDIDADPSLIERKNMEHPARPWNELPGDAVSWTEVHKCPVDGTVWEFENANF